MPPKRCRRWTSPALPRWPASSVLDDDCAHAGEPGCAVSAALKTGELEPARWASYQKLLAEARYHERSVDQRAAAETKRKWKVIHKAVRHHPKYDR